MKKEPMPTTELEALPPGALPFPTKLIESVCDALSYAGADREYIRALFRRHELGAATRPERLMLHLLFPICTGQPVAFTVNCDPPGPAAIDLIWPDSGAPLPLVEDVRRRVRARGRSTGVLITVFSFHRLQFLIAIFSSGQPH